MLILADRALSYDNRLAEAYTYRAFYYWKKVNLKNVLMKFISHWNTIQMIERFIMMKAFFVCICLEYTLDLVNGLVSVCINLLSLDIW